MKNPLQKVLSSGNDMALFVFILKNDGITGAEVARKYKMIPPVVSRSLKRLRAAGLVNVKAEEGERGNIKRLYASYATFISKQFGMDFSAEEIETLDAWFKEENREKLFKIENPGTAGEIHGIISVLTMILVKIILEAKDNKKVKPFAKKIIKSIYPKRKDIDTLLS